MIRATVLAALLVLTGCGAPVSTAEPVVTPESPPTPSPTEAAASVICEAFATGGPIDDAEEAAITTIRQENPARPTRDAISGFQELAARASGDEAEDLTAVAEAMDDAALSGEGYVGWNDAFEAFYVKYAEQCGEELAP